MVKNILLLLFISVSILANAQIVNTGKPIKNFPPEPEKFIKTFNTFMNQTSVKKPEVKKPIKEKIQRFVS